jgi:excisionase family DNA binding protein
MTPPDTTLSDKLVLTPEEVATLLACSKAHVYRLLRSGVLPSVDISNNPGGRSTKHRIRVTDLTEYLQSLEPTVPQP